MIKQFKRPATALTGQVFDTWNTGITKNYLFFSHDSDKWSALWKWARRAQFVSKIRQYPSNFRRCPMHRYKISDCNNVLPKIRTETGKKSIVYWGPKIWQEVPMYTKSQGLLLFKKLRQSFN